MKRFIYISSSIFPSTKANSVQVIKMCEELSKHYDVTLYGYHDNSTNKGINSLFENYDCQGNFNIKLKKKRSNVFYSISLLFELIFCSASFYYSRNLLVSILLLFIGKKNVFYEAHIDPASHPSYLKVLKPTLRYTKLKIISISSKLKDLIINYYSFESSRIFVAHDAADHKKFSMESNIATLKTDTNIGYIGSLNTGRGLDIVCELAKRNPKYSFNIIGGSFKNINELKKEYPFENLKFFGFQPYNRIPHYIKNQHILLAPYKFDLQIGEEVPINTVEYMSPLKIFEYMASKRPIILSDLEILHEVLDNNSGFFVDPNNIEAWNDALNTLIENEELYSSIANDAYKKFISNYTMEIRVKNIIKFMEYSD